MKVINNCRKNETKWIYKIIKFFHRPNRERGGTGLYHTRLVPWVGLGKWEGFASRKNRKARRTTTHTHTHNPTLGTQQICARCSIRSFGTEKQNGFCLRCAKIQRKPASYFHIKAWLSIPKLTHWGLLSAGRLDKDVNAPRWTGSLVSVPIFTSYIIIGSTGAFPSFFQPSYSHQQRSAGRKADGKRKMFVFHQTYFSSFILRSRHNPGGRVWVCYFPAHSGQRRSFFDFFCRASWNPLPVVLDKASFGCAQYFPATAVAWADCCVWTTATKKERIKDRSAKERSLWCGKCQQTNFRYDKWILNISCLHAGA